MITSQSLQKPNFKLNLSFFAIIYISNSSVMIVYQFNRFILSNLTNSFIDLDILLLLIIRGHPSDEYSLTYNVFVIYKTAHIK